MPASSYTHYKDPETGKTILLPQLFPYASCTGIMSSEEIKNWVHTGIIPQDLYESDVLNRQKMEEIRKRLQNGEKVSSSELPSTPWALTEYLLKNKGVVYGENVLKQIFSNLDDNDPDIVWLSFRNSFSASLKRKIYSLD